MTGRRLTLIISDAERRLIVNVDSFGLDKPSSSKPRVAVAHDGVDTAFDLALPARVTVLDAGATIYHEQFPAGDPA